MTVPSDRPVEILLVEDNRGDVHLTRKALREWEVPVNLTVAEDGEQALALLRAWGWGGRTNLPDLVLLDLNLPKLDGREVLARIKSDPELKHVPVIVLSTSREQADVLRSYQQHANCFLNKRDNFESFAALIKAVESFWIRRVELPPRC